MSDTEHFQNSDICNEDGDGDELESSDTDDMISQFEKEIAESQLQKEQNDEMIKDKLRIKMMQFQNKRLTNSAKSNKLETLQTKMEKQMQEEREKAERLREKKKIENKKKRERSRKAKLYKMTPELPVSETLKMT